MFALRELAFEGNLYTMNINLIFINSTNISIIIIKALENYWVLYTYCAVSFIWTLICILPNKLIIPISQQEKLWLTKSGNLPKVSRLISNGARFPV